MLREIVNQYNETNFLQLKQQILICTVSWGMFEQEHKILLLTVSLSDWILFFHWHLCKRGNVSLSLRKTERCTTQEIQFICLCKMSSFAPRICSQSHNREELIVVFFHESKVCFLSWPTDNIFQMQHVLDLTSEFEKPEHWRNTFAD